MGLVELHAPVNNTKQYDVKRTEEKESLVTALSSVSIDSTLALNSLLVYCSLNSLLVYCSHTLPSVYLLLLHFLTHCSLPLPCHATSALNFAFLHSHAP